mmetsp:Transcript_38107/g.89280  ORF Transcript_38107/g.89280 Transcript_38107/m.89280 type:complete len:253 (+) Transcript_38107:804-1562(+)
MLEHLCKDLCQRQSLRLLVLPRCELWSICAELCRHRRRHHLCGELGEACGSSLPLSLILAVLIIGKIECLPLNLTRLCRHVVAADPVVGPAAVSVAVHHCVVSLRFSTFAVLLHLLLHLRWGIEVHRPLHNRSRPGACSPILGSPCYGLPTALSSDEDAIPTHPLLLVAILGNRKSLVWHSVLDKSSQIRRPSSFPFSYVSWHHCDEMTQTVKPIANEVRGIEAFAIGCLHIRVIVIFVVALACLIIRVQSS